MSEFLCGYCGKELADASTPHDLGDCAEYLKTTTNTLKAEITSLTSLLARLGEVGDELAGLTISWDEGSQKYFCAHTDCHGAKHWNEVVHDDDCPVTKWDALKKEMEG